MGRKRRRTTKKLNSLIYLIAVCIVAILSIFGIKFGTGNQGNTAVNVANIENLQNITIKTAKNITNEFVSENNENLKVYFFDVGQADSILVVNQNQTMMIDAGNNEDGELLVENLKTLGISKIDYLIGTHPHEDHIGGLDDIIKNFDIGTIYMPKVQTNTKTFEDVLDATLDKNLSISTPKIDEMFKIGETNCTVLSVGNDSKNLNLSSIVIQMKFDGLSYLFMGDAEKEVEEKILTNKKKNIKSNILKVGHHGSDTSSSEKFLQVVAPELAIISVEKGNSYGHPNQVVLDRLNKIGSKVYRTDEVRKRIYRTKNSTTREKLLAKRYFSRNKEQ